MVADEQQDGIGVQALQQIEGNRLLDAFALPSCWPAARWRGSPSPTMASYRILNAAPSALPNSTSFCRAASHL
jgi:hypothetical protein